MHINAAFQMIFCHRSQLQKSGCSYVMRWCVCARPCAFLTSLKGSRNTAVCQIASHLHKYYCIVLLEGSGDISIKYPSLVLQYCMYTFFSTIQETQPKIRISWHAHCKVIRIGCSFEPILWNEQNIAVVGFSQQVAINHKKRD